MTTVATPAATPVGELLRDWRRQRRLSQLELSINTGTSTRHLSFVETGRSRPSSEMILRLCEQLDLPLRERNRLLLAGGFAPVYPENALEDPAMQPSLDAVRQVHSAHQPNPALAVDHAWNVIATNGSLGLFLAGVDESLLTGRVNALRLSLHPSGMAPSIVNLGEWRGHVLRNLRRHLAVTGSQELRELYDELVGYPCDQEVPLVETPAAGGVHVPLRLRVDDTVLQFFAIISTFGTALDVSLSELSIESFLPADPDTAAYLRSHT
jgi:transcriptional regulator with XRE-family HTH domain